MIWRREKGGQRPLALRLVLSYSVFLLLCLVLGVVLYLSSTNHARDNYWHQQTARLENAVKTMDSYLTAMDNYTRQLLNDSTFVRFAHMDGLQEYGYVTTAYKVKNELASRLFSLAHVPVENVSIYLKKADCVISGSQYTDAEQYYRAYRTLAPGHYAAWRDTLLGAPSEGENVDASLFTKIKDDVMFVRNMDDILPRSVPAAIWFEWKTKEVRDLFIQKDVGEEALVLAVNADFKTQWLLSGSRADLSLAAGFDSLAFGGEGYAPLGEMNVVRAVSKKTGWTYMMAIPAALCAQALGNYDAPFAIMLLMAALFGGALIARMVRGHMKPIKVLGTQVKQLEGDRDQLQMEMALQRPAVCEDYTRKLLSGHITSNDEFAYVMRYVGLGDNVKHYVLNCVVYDQSNSQDTLKAKEIVPDALPKYLTTSYPMYFYETLSHSYVVLMTYGMDAEETLMDVQARVLSLHNHLLSDHALWLYAGVGEMCTRPIHLWKAFEQARTAARYTARHHVFLPYEVMRKDSQTVYYPVEISAKLLHFITAGNKPQVVELFALIHRENIQERTLPINRLNFLLSDLRNTLLKVRFSISQKEGEHDPVLDLLDEMLGEEPTFALCERAALTLCDFFLETAVESNPVPEIEKYLNTNYQDPSMCLTKLSDRFNISESYLSHLFKEKTGQNFSVYLENLRLTQAARRLESKDCDLSMLYIELGYNNAASFRRAFKKRYGITPSAMKQG